jgi:hypothetical protein
MQFGGAEVGRQTPASMHIRTTIDRFHFFSLRVLSVKYLGQPFSAALVFLVATLVYSFILVKYVVALK